MGNKYCTVSHASEGEYLQCNNSPTFAQLPLTEIPQFLEESQRIGVMGMTRNFRNWVRE